jgi:hypothetical protein
MKTSVFAEFVPFLKKLSDEEVCDGSWVYFFFQKKKRGCRKNIIETQELLGKNK